MNQYDVIIVGAGFAGSVLAERFANDGKSVLVLEKRDHIAGNMYEDEINQIRVHKYGPHIFHTNSQEVFNYVKNFGEWYFYEHRVLGKIDGKLVPIPFNFKSIELLFPMEKTKRIQQKLIEQYGLNQKVSILELIESDDALLKEFGQYVYEKVFIHYTAKQWNISIQHVDSSVINRVPVLIGYDDRYFQDEYQFMPKNGFNEIFNNMLNSPNIEIRTFVNATDLIEFDYETNKIKLEGSNFDGILIYTGAIDELLQYKYGALPYRSVRMDFETKPMNFYQPTAVVNYPNEEDYTRITEFKYLNHDFLVDNTVILKEYPLTFDYQNPNHVPYYAIANKENETLYDNYVADVKEFENLFLCGRLAEYKYYNMDAVILRALQLYEEIKNK